MELTRSPRLARRLLTVFFAVSLALVLLWLALPKLLGLAAERWLNIPGLQDLRVDIEQVDSGQARLRELSAVYYSPGGDRIQFVLNGIDVDYSLTDRHVHRLHVARGELAAFSQSTAEPSPWPPLEIPQLPLGNLQIELLKVSAHLPDLPPFETQGRALLRQTDGVATFEFLPGDDRFSLQTAPQRSDGKLEFHANWQPATGPAANAVLLVDRQPAQQPASLIAQTPLPLLAELGNHFGLTLPLTDLQGEVAVTAQIQLGQKAGSVQSINGTATLTQASGQIVGMQNPQKVALNGELKIAWQPQPASAKVTLQPGFGWRLASGGSQALQAGGQLDQPFSLQLDARGVVSDGELPFALTSYQWGQWEGSLQQLRWQRANEQSAWGDAEAKLRFKGQLKTWQQDGLQVRDLKASGAVDTTWSPATGMRSTLAAEATIGRLSRSGDSPLSIKNANWQLSAKATAKSSADLWDGLSLQGEASSPQLTIEPASGPALSVGASRIQLLPLRPISLGSPKQKIDLLLAVKTLRYGTWPAPDLNARLHINGKTLRAEGGLQFEGTEVIRFTGSQPLTGACGDATVYIQQALPTLSRLLQPRPPALLPLALPAGQVDGRFDLAWCTPPAPHLDVKGTLRLRDTTAGWDKAQIEALQATLTLDGLQPLQGRLQVAAARGGLATGTEFTDLNAELALTPGELAVQAFDLKLLGGAVHSKPVRVAWPLGEQTLPLEIRQIDLGQLLALFEVEGLAGSGQLDGVLPLTYRDGSLEIDNGLLSSPGIGALKYAPTHALPDNPGLQALRNFHFQQLRAHLSYAANGAYRTQIKLEGNNPDFYSGYPIRFGLNVNGELPGVFRSAIFSGDFNRHILEQLQSGKLQ